MVRPDTHLIDMAEVRKLAQEHKPRIIIVGQGRKRVYVGDRVLVYDPYKADLPFLARSS